VRQLVATVAETLLSLKGKRVWVSGHRGMVGSAIVRRLVQEECHLLTVERRDVDLRCQAKVDQWVVDQTPEVIFLAAGRVGGIEANDRSPGAFLYDNLMIAANIMEAARRSGVAKLLFLGSSCIYPKFAPQPINEDALLSGPLEPTNQWYAIAKIAGIKLAQAYGREYGCDFVSIQPTNLYGPGDNFDPATSHVPAALLRRFHEAKIEGRTDVTVWGTGTPRREFLYVDDLADACVFVMQHYSGSDPLNVGTGEDVTIADFAGLIAETVGYKGNVVFDRTKPDGTPRKLLDVSRLASHGWRARTELVEGLRRYYASFLSAIDR
jgi:GDP-L-fucose synthase